MGTWSYKKSIIVFSSVGLGLILFGQNFEFIIPNTLLRPPTSDEVLVKYIRTPQAVVKNRNIIEKYFFDRPASFTQQDMKYEAFGNKLLSHSVEKFLEDDEFKRSELGRTYQEIEKKAQVNVKIKAPKITALELLQLDINDIEAGANQHQAYVKMQNAKMSYSVQSQNMDILYQRQKTNQSFGVGYDPKSDSSSVKMQLSW